MWRCPVCKNENNNGNICTRCGFDRSCDYERSRTLCPVQGETIASISGHTADFMQSGWDGSALKIFLCPWCGGSRFSVLLNEMDLACIDCGAKVPLSDIPTGPNSVGWIFTAEEREKTGDCILPLGEETTKALPFDIRDFWRNRLPDVQTAMLQEAPLTQEMISKVLKIMPAFLEVTYNKNRALSPKMMEELHHGLREDAIIGVFLLQPWNSIGLVVTEEALYISLPGEKGCLAVCYKDIKDVKTVQENNGDQGLSILLKNGLIRLCMTDRKGCDGHDYINFEKLAQILRELKEYYQIK